MTEPLPLSREARIERAEREVIRLTGSGPGGQLDRNFRMTIPAEPDRDSDLVLMDGLAAGREALDAARTPSQPCRHDARWLEDYTRWAVEMDRREHARTPSQPDLREALREPIEWLADIARCGEAALAKWQEAHRNEETLALTFHGADGPFYEGIRSVVERIRDYHFEATKRALASQPAPADPTICIHCGMSDFSCVAIANVQGGSCCDDCDHPGEPSPADPSDIRSRIAALRPWPEGERLIQALERLASQPAPADPDMAHRYRQGSTWGRCRDCGQRWRDHQRPAPAGVRVTESEWDFAVAEKEERSE